MAGNGHLNWRFMWGFIRVLMHLDGFKWVYVDLCGF